MNTSQPPHATPPQSIDGVPLTHQDLLVPTAGGQQIRLHAVIAGPASGHTVLMLHGFPEYWAAWERQVAPLTRAGFRVVMPDMRGYNLSEKPQDIASYRLSTLVADIAGLIELLGGPVDLIAHDWGGIVAWDLAIRHPELLRKLVILNAPHPKRTREVMKLPAQKKSSWYVGYFQLPALPELTLQPFGNWALQGTNPEAYTPTEKEGYRQTWRQPGAARGMINYYRALGRYGHDRQSGDGSVNVPTLVIWGQRDVALRPEMADGLERWVSDLRVVRLPRASHWVMRDEAVKVNNLLLDFLD